MTEEENINLELLFSFFWVFRRFEAALRMAGYVKPGGLRWIGGVLLSVGDVCEGAGEGLCGTVGAHVRGDRGDGTPIGARPADGVDP